MRLWMKSLSVTIQIKTTEQYFPVVLFIMLYQVVLTMMGGLCYRITVKKNTELVLIPIIAVPEYTFFEFRR